MYRFFSSAALALVLVFPTITEACHGGSGKHSKHHWKHHGGSGKCGKKPMSLPPKNLCTIPNKQYQSEPFDINGETHYLSIVMNNTLPLIQLVEMADDSRAKIGKQYFAMQVAIPPSWFERLHKTISPQTQSTGMTLFRPAVEPERACKNNLVFFQWEKNDKVSVPAYFSGFVGFELKDNGTLDGVANFTTDSYTTVIREYVLRPVEE